MKFFQKSVLGLGSVICLSAVLWGCAHTPVGLGNAKDAKALLVQACFPGRQVQEVKGSVWLKAKSKEASGQFPASVLARNPDSLRLEVTNLIGGTEALISIQAQKYSIKVPNREERSEKGYGSWGGIPLHWATELFLGRIPCPAHPDSDEVLSSVDEHGGLRLEIPASVQGDAETYFYQFRSWGGKPWPESLHWERKGALAVAVDFKFDDPEDGTRSPKKWEAKSAQGEVKARWKEREVTPTLR